MGDLVSDRIDLTLWSVTVVDDNQLGVAGNDTHAREGGGVDFQQLVAVCVRNACELRQDDYVYAFFDGKVNGVQAAAVGEAEVFALQERKTLGLGLETMLHASALAGVRRLGPGQLVLGTVAVALSELVVGRPQHRRDRVGAL